MANIAIVFLVLAATIVLQLVVSAWLLQGGLRLSRATGTTFKKGIVTTLALGIINLAIVAVAAGLLLVVPPDSFLSGCVAVGGLGLHVVLSLRVLCSRHEISRKQAFVVWLILLFAGIPNWVLAETAIRPFLFEAFRIPLNSMAPTLCGEHLRENCPACGGTLIISSYAAKLDRDLGICKDCLRTNEVEIHNRKMFGGDRVLTCKFLKPHRGDLIVFRYPEEPSTIYVKRLVGLPGETLSIHDGSVWIDGREQQKPPELSGLTYILNVFQEDATIWGPVTLGADESFVLGDFSARSKDSRYWETGASGHPPYAVPDSHIVGVVTHIYWPPSRWRVFR